MTAPYPNLNPSNLFLFLFFVFISNIAYADISSGLVAHYPLNGNANDASGNGNHGTVFGNVDFSANDRNGQASGAISISNNQSYIKIPHNTQLEVQAHTISAWVKRKLGYVTGGNGGVFTNGYSFESYGLVASENAIASWINYPNQPNQGVHNFYTNILEDQQYHHIAATYDGNTRRLWIDGNQVSELEFSAVIDHSYTEDSYIGMDFPGGNDWFSGSIDELRIYNRALSFFEIQVLASSGLVAYYPFDGNANDVSGNGNDGTEHGGVTYNTGVNGQAASFDGVDDTFSLPSAIEVLGNTPSGYTTSVWFSASKLNITQNTLLSDYYSSGYDNEYGIHLLLSIDAELTSSMRYYDNGHIGVGISSTTIVSINEWNFATQVVDFNEGTLKLYLNGKLEAQTNINNQVVYFGNTPMHVGSSVFQGVYNALFEGSIDDLRIYNRALSESAIQKLYNNDIGLVAHYPFDGNANDASGNGNDGTENGDVTYTTGVNGQAANFDGIDDYIKVLDSPSLSLTNMTINLWFKAAKPVNPGVVSERYQRLIGKWSKDENGDTSTAYNEYNIWLDDGLIRSTILSGDNMNGSFKFDTEWHQLTIVYKNSSRQMYIDTALVANENSSSPINNALSPIIIGGGGSDLPIPIYMFEGLIDELRIHNRALSSSEIQQLYIQDQTFNYTKPNPATSDYSENTAASAEGSNEGNCRINATGSPGPVTVANGNFTHTHTDFSIPSLGPDLRITRYYNSHDLYDGPFGHGWNMDYTAQLVVAQSDSATPEVTATVRLGNGVRRVFTKQVDNSWKAPDGQDDTLFEPGDGSYIFNGTCGIDCIPKPRRSYSFRTDNGFITGITDKNANALSIAYNGNGRIHIVTDANSRTLTFAYGVNGRVETITDFDNRVWTYAYDANDNLTSVTDPLTHSITYQYDTNHNLTGIVDAAGQTVASVGYEAGTEKANLFTDNGGSYDLSYNPVTQTTSKTNPASGLFSFQYDQNGNITNKSGPESFSQQLTWDANVNISDKQNAVGSNTRYTYDLQHNLTQQILDAGTGKLNLTSSWQYDTVTGQVSQTTDAKNVVTQMVYDSNGDLDTITRDPTGLNVQTDYSYNTNGQLIQTTDADGIATAYEYDANGYLIRTHNPRVDVAGGDTPIETTFTYDARGNRLTKTDANDNVTTYTYDVLNHLKTVKDALNNTSSFDYDVNDNLIRITDPKLVKTEFTYDTFARLTRRIDAVGDPLERQTDYTYDTRGNLLSVTDPLLKATTYTYDLRSRMTQVCDHLIQCWSFTYDATDNLISKTDPNGNATTYSYDAVNRLSSVMDAEGHTTTYTYDNNSNLLTVTDANSHIATTNSYDNLNRISSTKDPLDNTSSYTYTAAGRINTKLDANGNTITYVYDSVTGRPNEIQYPLSRTETFSYDAAGNLLSLSDNTTGESISYTYDAQNRVKTETQQGKTLTYDYDINGNRSTLSATDIGSFTYSYDNLNRLTSVTNPDTETTALNYNAADLRIKITYGNTAYSEYSYDNANRLSQILHKKSDTTLLTGHGYSYDNMNNRLTESDGNGATLITHTYDKTYKLKTSLYTDTAETIAFNYDGTGNRTLRSDASGTTTYTYDIANRIATQSSSADGSSISITHDANGNIQSKVKTLADTSTETTLYSYDIKNQLTQLQLPDSSIYNYYYDPNGRRAQSIETNTSIHLYDGHNPLAELDIVGNILTSYTPALGLDVLASRKDSGSTEYYLRDGLNSVRGILDSSQTLTDTSHYNPYGAIRSSTGASSSPFTFTGRRVVPNTELMYYRSRYYDTTTGRFLKKDSYKGKANEPLSLHRYAYVQNNPGNFVDPEGKFLCGGICMGVAAVYVAGKSLYSMYEGSKEFDTVINKGAPSNSRERFVKFHHIIGEGTYGIADALTLGSIGTYSSWNKDKVNNLGDRPGDKTDLAIDLITFSNTGFIPLDDFGNYIFRTPLKNAINDFQDSFDKEKVINNTYSVGGYSDPTKQLQMTRTPVTQLEGCN